MHTSIGIGYGRATHLCHLYHCLPLLLAHLLPTDMRTHSIYLPVHPWWDLPHRLHICNLLLLPLQLCLGVLLSEILLALRNGHCLCLNCLLLGYGGLIAVVPLDQSLDVGLIEHLDIRLQLR